MTTPTDATLDALARAVLADPAAGLPRLVLADYLDEHDDPALAFAYRWCARRDRRPCRVPEGGWWEWHFPDGSPDTAPTLPAALEPVMAQGRHRHTRHASHADAVRALAGGLAALRRLLDGP